MRTKELRKAVRSSVTAALGFLTGILVLLAMPGIAPAGTTERVSVDGAGNQGDSLSSQAAISADGRFVAFSSSSTNLVPGDTNGMPDVFVHDRQTGTTERVSVDSAGNQGDGPSGGAAISADGRFVAFISSATNLVPGDTNGDFDVFVHDRQTRTTERVSVDSAGNQANGPTSGGTNRPSISADGRFVAFTSFASNLVPGDTNGTGDPRRGPGFDVFVHDRQTRTTERVSVDSGGIEGNHNSREPSISADGRFVAFTSDATNLVPGDTNASPDVFVRDRETGTTELVSVNSAGVQQGPNTFTGQAIISPSISADGRFVAFASDASNLVPGDTNGRILVNVFGMDVFVHDRQTRTTERVSVDSAGAQTFSTYPIFTSISADGRFVAFDSDATDLVRRDTNGVRDVFVHDRLARITKGVTVGPAGMTQGNGASSTPSISADGRVVAFQSGASNLVPEDTNGTLDVFAHGRDALP